MRVLWFTNLPPMGMSRALGRPPEVTGGWMSALLDQLRTQSDLTLGVACAVPDQPANTKQVVDGVAYYSMPTTRWEACRPTNGFLRACEAAERDFDPDVTHVHGTERLYGLYTAHRAAGPPAIISIQGLIHVYSRHVDGGLDLAGAAEAGLPGVLSWFRFLVQQRAWVRRGRIERQILGTNRYFIGRTDWDRAHVLANNPTAKYFHCGEALRPAFYRSKWEADRAEPQTIFCTAAHSPLKGFHLVLEAVSMLRRDFPEIMVRVAGAPWNAEQGFGYYGRFLKSIIDRRDLGRHVTPLPALGDEGVAAELVRSSAFVLPSLIENSPNSLGEAMRVGTPCVASMVGGVPSMVEEGRTALGFPAGDAACLAHCLRRLFSDPQLAARLSASAREQAVRRYNIDEIVANQVRIYREIIADRHSQGEQRSHSPRTS